MVRIFPIKELEDRRKVLTQRSEAYRRIIRADVDGVGYAITRLRHRLGPVRGVWRFLNVISPIASMFSGRGNSRPGLFARVLSGISFATEILGALKKSHPAPGAAIEQTENSRAV